MFILDAVPAAYLHAVSIGAAQAVAAGIVSVLLQQDAVSIVFQEISPHIITELPPCITLRFCRKEVILPCLPVIPVIRESEHRSVQFRCMDQPVLQVVAIGDFPRLSVLPFLPNRKDIPGFVIGDAGSPPDAVLLILHALFRDPAPAVMLPADAVSFRGGHGS